jgi:hypothetical protein
VTTFRFSYNCDQGQKFATWLGGQRQGFDPIQLRVIGKVIEQI